MARPSGRPLREELVDATRTLIQQVGVGQFSYGDLAKLLDIKAPSIHHHFRTKEDLVAEVAARYRNDFLLAVHAIDGATAKERLLAYASLFSATSANEMLCLCGAVAAEWMTVGESPRLIVEGFFDDQLNWLTAQIRGGVAAGEFRADLDVDAMAASLLAALEGALLMVRANGDDHLPSAMANALMQLMES